MTMSLQVFWLVETSYSMLSEAMCVQKSGVVIAENTKLMHSLYWLKI